MLLIQFIDDPDDRKFAALAEASGSTLVTNDDHLLSRRGQLGMPVMTPGEFLRSVEKPILGRSDCAGLAGKG